VLVPRSSSGNQFTLNGQTFADSIALSAAGNYEVAKEIMGCRFQTTFTLRTEDCSPRIFLPTAFSPNRDGVNDQYFPQGEQFEVRHLRIFDRWGGLVYASKRGIWDGTAQGQEAPIGLYLAVLSFWNPRTQQSEQLTQEVMLVR
jgi:gliding motility-associated-like protein